MTDISLTPLQADAVKRTVEWFRTGTKQQKIWRIFGYAGVGKSTILKHIIDELGAAAMPRVTRKDRNAIDDFDDEPAHTESKKDAAPKVMFGAFTGKAALVMGRKGTPASTIHSMIYAVVQPTEAAIDKAKAELAKLRETPCPDGAEGLLHRALIRDRENQLKNMHRPSFVINTESPVRDADLIVLDEVSMVGDDMATDLMSFNKPILVLGDPGQLPPIRGEGAFTQATPDVMLTEIHRQAGESAIIRLATLAREGKPIPSGQHDEFVWKLRRSDVGPEQLLRGGQVICGFNATRIGLNNDMKSAAGFTASYPVGGEKIICLKNRNDMGLINGQFLELSDPGDLADHAFMADIVTEDGVKIGRLPVYRGHFDDHVHLDKDRDSRDWKHKRGLVECVWGYAITAHKAQGSQWTNIIIFDDGFGRTIEDRSRWMYTAITRAESGLVILQ